MFLAALKRSLQINIKHAKDNNLLRFSSSFKAGNDISEAMDIEASLFENSKLQHEPINTRQALRKQKIFAKNKKFRTTFPQPSASELNTSTLVLPKKTTPSSSPAIKHEPAPLIKDSELNLEFTRLTMQDPLMSTLLTTVRSRKQRDKQNKIIIEGRRLIQEALQCGLHMDCLFFSQRDQLAKMSAEVAKAQIELKTKIYKVPQHDLKTWSSLVTPPGLMALFERPKPQDVQRQQKATFPLPITVVCDNIREPNNLGSIIRTCAALPCSQVVVTHGCCDPWESKALRGGCGGQFRVPIQENVNWKDVAMHIPPETAEDCHIFIAENKADKLSDESFSSINYAELKQTGAHNILIIGGESHGVSDDAYNFMKLVGDKGKCVYIPLAMGSDSLNVTSALTLILFEIRRQLLEKIELE